MNARLQSSPARTVALLKRFVPSSRTTREHCELCSLPVPPEHRHLLEHEQIICACDGCALRFEGVIGGRFKLIPRNASLLVDFQMSDGEWDDLALPIDLAFIYHSTSAGKMVAKYPSPAGSTESLLPFENWTALVQKNPLLSRLNSDVEALLINRVGHAREYFIVPIDKAYELVGLVRKHWRGLTGGDAVWQELTAFFDQLKNRCAIARNPAPETSHA